MIRPRFGTLCVSQSIIGIELDRLIEVSDSFAIVLDIPTLKMEMTLEVSVMRFYVRRQHFFEPNPIRAKSLSATQRPPWRFPPALRKISFSSRSNVRVQS